MPTLGLHPDVAAAAWTALLVGLPAMALAWALRASRAPGGRDAAQAAVVAGVIVGVLAGPGVLGVAAREFHRETFVGASVERETLSRIRAEHAREMAALAMSGVTPEAVDERRAELRAMEAPLQVAYEAALQSRRESVEAVGLAGVIVCGLGQFVLARRRSPSRPPSRDGSAGVGAATVVLPILIAGSAAAAFTGLEWRALAGFAAASAVLWAAPGLRARMLGSASRDRRTDTACLAGALVGLCAALAAAGLYYAAGAVLALAGASRFVRAERRAARAVRRALRWAVYAAAAPTLVAVAASRVDPHAIGSTALFWILAASALVAGSDGRWGAAWLAWRARLGRGAGREAAQRATAMVAGGVGVAQAACALVLHAAGVIPPEALGALLLSALVVELAGSSYRLLAAGPPAGAGRGAVGGAVSGG